MSHYLREEAILLVPGHWLGAWAWNEVAAVLRVLEHRAIPVTLPGLDPQDADRATRTLAEQADALIALARAARDSSDRRVVIVGHSGANAPISMVLDAEPDLFDRVIWVDSGPVGNGHVFAPDLAEGTIEVPLPAVEVLGQQASLAGLDSAALDRFARLAVPEPATILTGSVELTNDNRNGVPTTIICCSLPSAQLWELAEAQHPMFVEVLALRDVATVDLPTGHWPMWSVPRELAMLISAILSEENVRPST